jgi:hypothetical protein
MLANASNKKAPDPGILPIESFARAVPGKEMPLAGELLLRERGHDISLQQRLILFKASRPAIRTLSATIPQVIPGQVQSQHFRPTAPDFDQETLRCELLC